MSDIFDDFPKIENSRIIDDPDDYGSSVPNPNDDEAYSSVNASMDGSLVEHGLTADVCADKECLDNMDSRYSADAFEADSDYSSEDGSDDGKNNDLTVQIISADDVEVMRDYPDSSTDIDIDLKYQRFIDYYLTCGNKKKAAKLAGFNAKNDESLRVMASKAFKRPEVAAYYKLKKAEMAAKADIQRDAYMAELVSIATLDIADVVESHVVANTIEGEPVYVVTFKDMADIPLYARKAVKQIKINKDGSPEMIFYDKLAALKLLGEIKGYLSADGNNDGDEADIGIAMIPSVLPDEE